jgi:YHS domain-containing protein
MKKYLAFPLLLLGCLAQAQQVEFRKKEYNLQDHLALKGYDPASYFSGKKPLKGDKKITYTYQEVTYRFASQANLEMFKKNPAMYEPQYGGWCAYAMGKSGEKVEIDPETYKIKDGKLYLFYNQFFNNTLPKWNENENVLKKKADESWMKFYK